MGCCYDCLNVPSLLAFEILARRIYQITDAYSVPGEISWANAKYFKGTTGIHEIVPAEMGSFVHRESRAEVELAAARPRQQSFSGGGGGSPAKGAWDGNGGGPGLPPGDTPAASKAKGGGRAGKGGAKSGGRTRNAGGAALSP